MITAERVYLACDHGGLAAKEICVSLLENLGYTVEDLGTMSADSVDYPDFADKLCRNMGPNENIKGLLLCGSGQGMAMRANKYPHIRAALCWNTESAKLAREHNDANVLCLGARLLSPEMIQDCINIFFKTAFEGGRHQRRIDKLAQPV